MPGPKEDIFKSADLAKIAGSLERSAEHSKRRKGTPLQPGDFDAELLHLIAKARIYRPNRSICSSAARTNCGSRSAAPHQATRGRYLPPMALDPISFATASSLWPHLGWP